MIYIIVLLWAFAVAMLGIGILGVNWGAYFCAVFYALLALDMTRFERQLHRLRKAAKTEEPPGP